MYRFISINTYGPIISFAFTSLLDAYKQCIPDDESHTHRMLYMPVKQLLDKGQKLVLVSYDMAHKPPTVNYIQFMDEGPNTRIPMVSELPEPPCCADHH